MPGIRIERCHTQGDDLSGTCQRRSRQRTDSFRSDDNNEPRRNAIPTRMRCYRPIIACVSGILLLAMLSLSACEFPTSQTPVATDAPLVASTATSEPTVTSTPIPIPTQATRVPTAIPQPSPTYDPVLSDWTLLVYMDADNNLERSALKDFNEMEAAGKSDRINVVVQIDRSLEETTVDDNWSEARRYLVTGDADSDRITSEQLDSLGEINMGDPAVLQEFLTWGIRNYPSNRYALIIWDHGAGWNGIAFDEDVGFADASDHISLPDLKKALAGALAETGLDKLDLIGFDACLMGQLELYNAIYPFGEFAVGSEELTPGNGWDYKNLLRRLYTEPSQDGASAAKTVVSSFADYYRLTETNDYVTMSAVDLSLLPELAFALEQLSTSLAEDPQFVSGAVGDARGGALAFARAYPESVDSHSSIDLRHFAEILSERSFDDEVRSNAAALIEAIEAAVIANEYGAGMRNSGGVSIYFPRSADLMLPEYEQVSDLTGWQSFLSSYHTVGLADSTTPQIGFTNVLTEGAGAQNPAYLEFEVAGRGVENVYLIGGRYEPDGRELLLEHDLLLPEPQSLPDGTENHEWRDGVHEDFFVWDTEVTYLYDLDGNGDFVVMWPTAAGNPLFAVQGRYRRAGSGTYSEANLLFDHSVGALAGLWSHHSGVVTELDPGKGDEFQPYLLYRGTDGMILREPGQSLTFDDLGHIYFQWRSLPDGNYFLGLQAENVAGELTETFTDVTVINSDNRDQLIAYLDPYLGFQFLYPSDWSLPAYGNGVLHTSSESGATQLQATLFPGLEFGASADSLTRQALNEFGPVDILFPTQPVIIGGTRGQRTVYGYEGSDVGLRTGILLTFIINGDGFAVDIDGPASDEPGTIAQSDLLVESWSSRPARFGVQPGNWQAVDLEGFSVAQPAGFSYQEINSWQRFSSDRHTFVALRSQPTTISTPEVLAALMRDAAQGVDGFEQNEPFLSPLSGRLWLRSDFTYAVGASDKIWGFIMVTVDGGRELVAWAEAPSTTYNSLESDLFLVMISDIVRSK